MGPALSTPSDGVFTVRESDSDPVQIANDPIIQRLAQLSQVIKPAIPCNRAHPELHVSHDSWV